MGQRQEHGNEEKRHFTRDNNDESEKLMSIILQVIVEIKDAIQRNGLASCFGPLINTFIYCFVLF